jgi:hypothetical protein
MSQPAAALYIQLPMLETIVATQSIANSRYRKASSGDAPVERSSTATTQLYLAPRAATSTGSPALYRLAAIKAATSSFI